MSRLYPSLNEKFRNEGICPICLTEMAHFPRFSCDEGHVFCHRCRPYYFSCPQCFKPLTELPVPMIGSVPMPQPMAPSAPHLSDFHGHEREHSRWSPTPCPREGQQLLDCPYSHLGCSAKFVPELRSIHVSRCQYQQHGSLGGAPCVDEERLECRFARLGCNVRAPRHRLEQHEPMCIYREQQCGPWEQQLEGSSCESGDPNRMVECRYRELGCMVRMPLWKRPSHEQSCNHAAGRGPEPGCRWAQHGCDLQLGPHSRLEHERHCGYRMEECAYKWRGCPELLHPSRRLAHQGSCYYAR